MSGATFARGRTRRVDRLQCPQSMEITASVLARRAFLNHNLLRNQERGTSLKRLAPLCAFFVLCSTAAYALSPDQCSYFATDGKIAICHATGSAREPYVSLRISEQACINGHSEHPRDFVSAGDPTCSGLGCLPSGAPCDATLGCCDGLACIDGACREVDAPEMVCSSELTVDTVRD